MPLAATHVILTMVLVDLYRDHIAGKKFPLKFILIAGIAGLAPDIDIPIGWILSFLTGTPMNLHRGLTHTIIFPIIFAVVSFASFRTGRKNWGLFFAILSFGWLFHVGLDMFIWGETAMMPLYPFSNIQWHGLIMLEGETAFAIMSGIDAIVLVLWLIHEQLKHNIKDYI